MLNLLLLAVSGIHIRRRFYSRTYSVDVTGKSVSFQSPKSLLLWLPFLVRSIATGELLSQRRLEALALALGLAVAPPRQR